MNKTSNSENYVKTIFEKQNNNTTTSEIDLTSGLSRFPVTWLRLGGPSECIHGSGRSATATLLHADIEQQTNVQDI
jgi:hypothetical protein